VTRSAINLLVDAFSLIMFIALVMTGTLLVFVLPPGSRQASLWGMTRHEWGDVHFWIAISMIALIVVHLVLHWGWVCSMIVRVFGGSRGPVSLGKRWLFAVLLIVLLLTIGGGFVWIARNSVQPSSNERGRQHNRWQHTQSLPALEVRFTRRMRLES